MKTKFVIDEDCLNWGSNSTWRDHKFKEMNLKKHGFINRINPLEVYVIIDRKIDLNIGDVVFDLIDDSFIITYKVYHLKTNIIEYIGYIQ